MQNRSSGRSSSDARTTHEPASQRHAPIVSAEVRSTSPSESVELVRSCSDPVPDVRSAPEPRKSRSVSDKVPETPEPSMNCEGGDGRGTSDDDLGMPAIKDNPLTFWLEPYPSDPPGLLEDILAPGSFGATDAACAAPAAPLDPELLGARCREGAGDGALYSKSFHNLSCSRRIESSFDVSSVDPGMLSSHERRPFCCDADPLDWRVCISHTHFLSFIWPSFGIGPP